MAKMLYNGIELPDIDTVWTNKATYPYAFIHAHNSAYTLYIFADAPITGTITNYGDVCYVGAPSMTFVISNDAWKASGSSTYNTSVYYLNDYAIIWSNSDIINPDNTIYLEASDPTVPDMSIYPGINVDRFAAFMLGQQLRTGLMGLMSKRLVGYSYNGFIAPKLPNWNSNFYKYAIMYEANDGSGSIRIRITSTKPAYYYIGSSAGYWPTIHIRSGTTYEYLQIALVDGEWGAVETMAKDCSNETSTTHFYTPNVMWSNFDIYGSDVEVQFAASTPIPVYE